jgi:hypothetical protein
LTRSEMGSESRGRQVSATIAAPRLALD